MSSGGGRGGDLLFSVFVQANAHDGDVLVAQIRTNAGRAASVRCRFCVECRRGERPRGERGQGGWTRGAAGNLHGFCALNPGFVVQVLSKDMLMKRREANWMNVAASGGGGIGAYDAIIDPHCRCMRARACGGRQLHSICRQLHSICRRLHSICRRFVFNLLQLSCSAEAAAALEGWLCGV